MAASFRPKLRPTPPSVRQPFGHLRYPLVSPEEKRMTIAAGFVHRNGVMLCADSQIETATVKGFGAKVGSINGSGCKLAYAIAGNLTLATAAIQKCERILLHALKTSDPLAQIETVLSKAYVANVQSSPNYNSDPNLQYYILIAYQHNGTVTLHAMHETAMYRVDSHQCYGIGDSLAEQLIQKPFMPDQEEERVLHLAAYILGVVKRQVPGCGGATRIMNVSADGQCEDLSLNLDAVYVEVHTKLFDRLSRDLFLSQVNSSVSGDEFEGRLREFVEEMRAMRKEWESILSKNPSRTLRATGVQSDFQSTKGDPSRQQPSPE